MPHPLTSADFRRIALGLREVVESAHHGHPDFRVRGRIFATLGHPDASCGMVYLTPDQQRERIREHPAAFVPVNGAWGERGATTVRLPLVDEEALGEALTLAWQNIVRGREERPTAARRRTSAGAPGPRRRR